MGKERWERKKDSDWSRGKNSGGGVKSGTASIKFAEKHRSQSDNEIQQRKGGGTRKKGLTSKRPAATGDLYRTIAETLSLQKTERREELGN